MVQIINPIICGGGKSNLENPSNHGDTSFYNVDNPATTPGVNRYIDLSKKYSQAYLILFSCSNGNVTGANKVSPTVGSAQNVYSYRSKGGYNFWGYISVWKLTDVSGRINISAGGYGAYWSFIGVE